MMCKKCCSCDNKWKLVVILIFTFSYFLAEVIVGSLINSLSLVADAFHMFSDVLSIIIGLVAMRIAAIPRSGVNTFGWQRAEILGSLINCVSLMAFCFTILISAIERCLRPNIIESAVLMFGVGAGGLFINLIGIIIINPFSGSHQHSHGPSAPKKVNDTNLKYNKKKEKNPNKDTEIDNSETLGVMIFTSMKTNTLPQRSSSLISINEPQEEMSVNMKGVLFHIISDFLGSVIVCVSALVLIFAPGDPKTSAGQYKLYIDPVMSIIMIIIIAIPTVSLLKQTSLILLQSVPGEINIKELTDDLNNIDNVMGIHDLHVWRLQPKVIIGTAHVKVATLDEYRVISNDIKQLFHRYNIHSTTIQPEFPNLSGQITSEESEKCDVLCNTFDNCKPSICCTEDKV